MSPGPEAFLKPPGMSGYTLHLDPPQKKLCATLIRLVGHTTNTDFMQTELGHTLVDRVGRYTDLVRCVLTLLAVSQGAPWPASSSLRGPSPQGGLEPGGMVPEVPCFREMSPRPKAFLEPPGMSGYNSASGPTTKKALCHTHPVSVMYDKYQLNAALLLRRSTLYHSTRNKMATQIPTVTI